MFVLIWIHCSWWFQIWSWNFKILKFWELCDIFWHVVCSRLPRGKFNYVGTLYRTRTWASKGIPHFGLMQNIHWDAHHHSIPDRDLYVKIRGYKKAYFLAYKLPGWFSTAYLLVIQDISLIILVEQIYKVTLSWKFRENGLWSWTITAMPIRNCIARRYTFKYHQQSYTNHWHDCFWNWDSRSLWKGYHPSFNIFDHYITHNNYTYLFLRAHIIDLAQDTAFLQHFLKMCWWCGIIGSRLYLLYATEWRIIYNLLPNETANEYNSTFDPNTRDINLFSIRWLMTLSYVRADL